MGLLDFVGLVKIVFTLASFCPSANVKPMPNDLVHAMPLQCMYALSLSVYYDLYEPMQVQP